jgi:hypothetical protein
VTGFVELDVGVVSNVNVSCLVANVLLMVEMELSCVVFLLSIAVILVSKSVPFS